MGNCESPEAAAGKRLQEYENSADKISAIKLAWKVYKDPDTEEQARQAAFIALDEIITDL